MTLSAPGSTTGLNVAGILLHSMSYTVASIDTTVVMRLEGSHDNTNWYNLHSADTTITEDGTYHLDFLGPLRYIRLTFVSETGGTGATITNSYYGADTTLGPYLNFKSREFAAGSSISPTTGGAVIDQIELSSNKINYLYGTFPNASAASLLWHFIPANNWDGGALNATIYWTAASGAGDVVWQIAGARVDDDGDIDAAVGTAQISVDTFQDAEYIHEAPETAAITLAGSAGKFILLKLTRDPDHASDDFTGDAKFITMRIRYGVENDVE